MVEPAGDERDRFRVTIVTPSLSGGGAERVVQRLSAGFCDAGHAVTVITTTSRPDFYRLDEACERVSLDITGQPPGQARAFSSLWRVPLGLRRLRKAIIASDPDVVISFMEHVNVLTALLVGRRTRVVATEHINAAEIRPGVAWRLLRRLAYRRLDRLVSVSEGVDDCFEWLPRSKRLVILNPVGDPPSTAAAAPPLLPAGTPYLIAMGRLTEQKGFDLLLTAFAEVRPRHREWKLMILGEGEEREDLQRQVNSLSLDQHVLLPGRLDHPFPLVEKAECFVLSSRAEGFPMVLIEALSCGTPAVAFDCPSGPSEIIVPGQNGLLVPPLRTDLLAEALDAVMSDPSLRRRFASHAAASVAGLQLDRIVEQWEREVFADATPPRRAGA